MTKTLNTAALAAALALAFAVPAAAETWNMATPYPENNFHTQNHLQFAKDVAAATDGELEIVVHSAGSLIAHPKIRDAVRNGTVPMGEFLLSRLANEDVAFEIDAIPFLVENYEDGRALWAAQKAAVEELFAKQNMMVLYSVPWPANGIYTSSAVEAPEDFQGMKMRVYSAATEEIAQQLGAVPTQVEVPDIPQAFSTGRVGSMITSAATGVNVSAWDFLDNYYDAKVSFAKNIVVMNRRAFDRLDEATQKAVLEAAAAAEARGWEMSESDDKTMSAELAENGVAVDVPSEAVQGKLREIGEAMLADWTGRAGDRGQAILDAYRQ